MIYFLTDFANLLNIVFYLFVVVFLIFSVYIYREDIFLNLIVPIFQYLNYNLRLLFLRIRLKDVYKFVLKVELSDILYNFCFNKSFLDDESFVNNMKIDNLIFRKLNYYDIFGVDAVEKLGLNDDNVIKERYRLFLKFFNVFEDKIKGCNDDIKLIRNVVEEKFQLVFNKL